MKKPIKNYLFYENGARIISFCRDLKAKYEINDLLLESHEVTL